MFAWTSDENFRSVHVHQRQRFYLLIRLRGERTQGHMVMEKARKRGTNAAAAAAIAAASCASGSQDDGDQTIRHSAPPVESAGMGEAQAAAAEPAPAVTSQADAGLEAAADHVMPPDPAHISFQIAKVDDVRVLQSSGEEYPAHLKRVTQTPDATVVTLIVQRTQSAEEQGIEFTFQELRQVSTSQSGQPVLQVLEGGEHQVGFSIAARPQLATEERLTLGASFSEFNFGDGAQKVLELGENSLTGPVTEEFLDGEMRLVMQGVFTAPEDMTCSLSFIGCERAYIWLDGRMECQTGPCQIRLRAGQRLGVFPVVGAPGAEAEAVELDLQASPTPTQEE